MNINARVKAFTVLGSKIDEALSRSEGAYEGLTSGQINLLVAVKRAGMENGWFTPDMVRKALYGIVHMLQEDQLIDWMSRYPKLGTPEIQKEVGVIMAGNIPAVGFHDLLCVWLVGHKAVVKTSSDDQVLIPAIVQLLEEIEPLFKNYTIIQTQPRNQYDAILATGSNNSARYFEQYFGKFPNVIRKSRTSVAVITGEESKQELDLLALDLFTFYGLGCRNVSKILLVGDVGPEFILDHLAGYKKGMDISKYMNNLDYNKSIYLINRVPFLDGGTFFMKEDQALQSPISVTFYQHFDQMSDAEKYLAQESENIQCIVGKKKEWVDFGNAQTPNVFDYADGVDTVEFLLSI